MRNMQCKRYFRFWLCLCLITTFSFSVTAQNAHTVKGVVLDESNLPIIGANILIKNSSIGTITDIDGNYSIQVPQNGTLVYSDRKSVV